MNVRRAMVDAFKCALTYLVHIDAVVVEGIPKMVNNATVCLVLNYGVCVLNRNLIIAYYPTFVFMVSYVKQ